MAEHDQHHIVMSCRMICCIYIGASLPSDFIGVLVWFGVNIVLPSLHIAVMKRFDVSSSIVIGLLLCQVCITTSCRGFVALMLRHEMEHGCDVYLLLYQIGPSLSVSEIHKYLEASSSLFVATRLSRIIRA
jgi:hypothetical protein